MRATYILLVAALAAIAPAKCRADEVPLPDRRPQLVLDADGFSGEAIQRLTVSSQGSWLAAAAGKVVRIWNLKTGQLHATLRGYQERLGYQLGNIDSMTFSPDERFLVIGVSDNSEAGSTRVYRVDAPNDLFRLVPGHIGCTRGATFSSDGRYFATWGCDGNLNVYNWESDSGETSLMFKLRWRKSAVFKTTKVTIEAKDSNGVVQQVEVARQEQPIKDAIFQFAADNRHLILSTKLGTVCVSIGEKKAIVDWESLPPLLRDYSAISKKIERPFKDSRFTTDAAIDLSGSGSLWYARGGVSGTTSGDTPYWIALYRKVDGGIMKLLTTDFDPVAVCWAPAADIVAATDRLARIHIWSIRTGKSLFPPFQSVGQPIWNVSWNENGDGLTFAKSAFSKSYLNGGQYHYNNYGAPDSQFQFATLALSDYEGEVQSSTIYPRLGPYKIIPERNDSTKDVEGAVGGCRSCGTYGEDWKYGMFDLMAESKDGTRTNLHPLHDPARLYRCHNIQQLPHPTKFGRPMCFTVVTYADTAKESILVGTLNGELVECDIVTPANSLPGTTPLPELRIRRQFIGHSAMITSIAQSPDKKLIATSSLDGTIRIWQLKPARVLGDIDFLMDGSHIEYIPDGSYAQQAGLRDEDNVVSFGGKSVYERMADLADGRYKPGDAVPIVYDTVVMEKREDGSVVPKQDPNGELVSERKTTKITLAEAPDVIEPMLSFFLAKDQNWVVWTQLGYYESSPGGARYVGWHVNRRREEQADFYRLEQFQRHLNQRRVVRNVVRLGDANVAAEAVMKELAALPDPPVAIHSDKYSEFRKTVPPKVRILSPKRDSQVDLAGVLRVELSHPIEQPVTNVSISVGARMIPVRGSLVEESDSEEIRTVVYEYPVEFLNEDKSLTVRASNASGLSDSATLDIRVRNSTPVQYESNLYVLAIGISDHANKKLRLKHAAKDAKDFAAVWKNQEGGLYDRVSVKTILDEEATAIEIKRGMKWLQQQSLRERDVAMIFLSCHGVYDESDMWYLVAHDSDPLDIAITGISHSDLSLACRKIQSSVVLFADTCHSGALQVADGVKAIGVRQNNIWQDSQKIISFVSCRPDEVSFENDAWENGAFTLAVLESLDASKKADVNKNGVLDADEMKRFVLDRVADLTGDKQHPDLSVPPFVGIPPMAKISGVKAK